MKHFLSTALFGTLFLAVVSIQAAPLYWDPNATTGTALGGAGSWDLVGNVWYDGSSDIIWTDGNDAYFTGAAGTVTLQTSITAGNLFFTNTTESYVLTNATGGEVLTVAGGIDTGGGEHIIGAPIRNSGTLNKNGDGRLHLPVDNSGTLTGSLVINQGDVSVENNYGVGQNTSITVADGAALDLNGGTNGLTEFYPNVTINGSGITNSGALRNLSGVTTFYGQIILGENNSVIYADSGAALVCDAENGPLTDNGNNYNLIISASGTGNVHLGATSIGGTLIIEGPASCYTYLNGISPTDWRSTYISPGGTLYVENNNGFGTKPAALMTTNVLLDGGTINSAGTYTMYGTDGITVTTNGGTLTVASGTWTTCNIYSQSNTSVTIGGAGSSRPGGAAGTTTGTINFGTGALIKTGGGDCNLGYANPALEIYSNLVVNGGSVSFNYDQTSGQASSLGALPSTLNASNIILNGGSLHVGHSTTIGATRGIYIGSGGGTIQDVTSGGTVTIASPISGPGNVNFPLGKSGSTTAVTLAANNSYKNTTIGASSTVNVGSGGSTGTLGTGPTADNGTLIFNRTGSYSYDGVISGSGTVTKKASGTVTLTGANTYTGNTTHSAGTLLINNTSGSGTGTGALTVQNTATLGGTGSIGGAVTINAGGTLTPGTPSTPLGKLTINNNLTLAGNLAVSVNRTLQTSSQVAVTGTLANTGTGNIITVTNLDAPLVAGDKFYLFSQAISGGNTLQITGAGVTWINNLAVDGSIVVAGPLPTPVINNLSMSGTSLVMSGTNGSPNGGFYVLTTTNVTLPLSKWSRVLTNTFDGTGNFSITNDVGTNSQGFYILQLR